MARQAARGGRASRERPGAGPGARVVGARRRSRAGSGGADLQRQSTAGTRARGGEAAVDNEAHVVEAMTGRKMDRGPGCPRNKALLFFYLIIKRLSFDYCVLNQI
jgi:hypothetical protein